MLSPVNWLTVLYFKLLLCSECCILSFKWFPGAWILYADNSERSVCSIFTGGVSTTKLTRLWRWNRQCSESSAYKILAPGNHPKERIPFWSFTTFSSLWSISHFWSLLANTHHYWWFWKLFAILSLLNFICWHFGTLCLFRLHGRCKQEE